MRASSVESLLVAAFPKNHVSAMLRHFDEMARHFQSGRWEDSLAKGGKFVEAAVKSLLVHAKQTPAKGAAFKVDGALNILAGLVIGTVDKTVRITIPRCCRFVYEIASNRGGRHDPDEIDPNEMDAASVISSCSWIMAEMIRHAQRGSAASDDIKLIIDALMRRKYPLVEHIDGRTYFHKPKASATEVALVILSQRYPKRVRHDELMELLKHNKFSDQNARNAIARINHFLDFDANRHFLLLAPGLIKAETIFAEATE